MKIQDLIQESSILDRGVIRYLTRKGYRFLGQGIDQAAFLEPGTGHVLKVFGTQCLDNHLSEDQEMFKTYAEYCTRNHRNPHLPRIYGWETFMFPTDISSGVSMSKKTPKLNCLYLQIRTEPLNHVSNQLFHIYEAMSGEVESEKTWKEFVEEMYQGDVSYDSLSRRFQQMTTDDQSMRRMERLYKTMQNLYYFGQQEGYSWDLHGNNIMQRADGTPVITDPWVVSF